MQQQNNMGKPAKSHSATAVVSVRGIQELDRWWQWTIESINVSAPDFFFLILADPVYKMWIAQEPNTLELWNKLHFEKEKTESIYRV